MEDGKTLYHNNNLLHLLNLDPNSSSATSHLLPDADTLLGFFNHPLLPNYPLINTNIISGATPTTFSEISPYCSTDPPTGFGIDHRHPHLPKSNGVMGGKRRKMTTNMKGVAAMEKLPREVIHVRAKRGQATDSHSLAERVRRERINEKLKVLQDLVPGCYKTMGMAVMLDVIINYVQSLQNQIEFLSMKLSAASMFYNFNSPEAEAMEALQRTNPIEAREMERMMRDEGFDQGFASSAPPPSDHDLHSTWPF